MGNGSGISALSHGNAQISGSKAKAESFSNFLSHSTIDEANAQLPDENDFPEGLDSLLHQNKQVMT